MRAPHLPPKSCNIKFQNRLRTIPWILFFIFLAGLTGIATALITIAYIAPQTALLQSFYAIDQRARSMSNTIPDPFVRRGVLERMVYVYQAKEKTETGFFPQHAFVRDGALLSTDGWAALFYPDYTPNLYQSWAVIDNRGNEVAIQEAVFDAVNGIVYIQIERDGLRAMSFGQWNMLKPGTALWGVHDEQWGPALLTEPIFIGKETEEIYRIDSERFAFSTFETHENGSIFVDQDGRFLGFAEDQRIVPGYLVSEHIGSLLSTQTLQPREVPIFGFMVQGFVGEGSLQQVSGFYVASVEKMYQDVLQENDLIIEINGQAVGEETMHRIIHAAGDRLRLKLIRESEEVLVEVEKPSST